MTTKYEMSKMEWASSDEPHRCSCNWHHIHTGERVMDSQTVFCLFCGRDLGAEGEEVFKMILTPYYLNFTWGVTSFSKLKCPADEVIVDLYTVWRRKDLCLISYLLKLWSTNQMQWSFLSKWPKHSKHTILFVGLFFVTESDMKLKLTDQSVFYISFS